MLYEAPHRLEDTLADLLEVMGDRQVVVARELTKIYEEYARGTLSEVLAALPPAGRGVRSSSWWRRARPS